MKKIAYTGSDGRVRIVNPAPKSRLRILVSEAVLEPIVETRREKTGAIDGEGSAVIRERRISHGNRLVKPAVHRDETDDEFLARIMAADVPADATDAEIIDAADLPPYDEHRNHWKKVGGKVIVDKQRAVKPE